MPDSVPLMKEFGRLGLERFIEKHAVATQTDDRGFVDYGWLLSYIDSLVPKDHVWTGRLDVHHLQWEAHKYDASQYDPTVPDTDGNQIDASIPSRFREIPFHKLLIPRQMHDLIHIVTLPPEVPAYEEMKKRVQAFEVALDLFQAAKQAIDIEEQDKRLIPIGRPGYESMYLDRKKRRMIKREILLERYAEFTQKFESKLSTVDPAEVENLVRIDTADTRRPHGSLVSDWNKRIRMTSKRHALRPKIRWASSSFDEDAA